MSSVLDEMMAVYIDDADDEELMHYGTPRHSGRYPWGSGENPYQRTEDFVARYRSLRDQGLTEKEIADHMGLNTRQLRVQYSIAKDEQRMLQVDRARSLKEDHKGYTQIAKEMGIPESTVRSLLNTESEARMNKTRATADFLKEKVKEKGLIDVGAGTELGLGISKEKMEQALYALELEGYKVYNGRTPQVTNPGKWTTLKILCPPGSEYKEIYKPEDIHSLEDYISYDGGETFKKSFAYPASLDSKRLQIRYAEEGGINKDGVIELRRGCKDLDLGNSHYAQVRIMVDGTHYLKGMAVYSDNLPDGVDVLFNTNKHTGTPMTSVLKKIKEDPDNPFGSLIKEHGGQSYYIGKDGKEHLSLINKRAEEGDWEQWDKKLPAQFLAKQNINLINRQLSLTIADKRAEYDEICALTNPTVKKAMLQTFANDCDSAAVHLKAAALPRQRYQVILPLTSIKDNEVYAPNFKDGESIALVRFPHAGTFEIPILKVNNKIAEGKSVIGPNPIDAIGISSKVAERLSGADFDGDTVLAIPTGGKIKITSTPRLEGLIDFDPKEQYPERAGMKYMTKAATQQEMGKISNLITDMTLKGADADELARAVRHSMVVIDAEKHHLDYKKSEADNGIAALKKAYQGIPDENGVIKGSGASTLISRASAETHPLKTTGQPWINADTGELEWERINPKTGEYESKIVREEYTDKKTGATKLRTKTSTQMADTKDAYTLSSGTVQEDAYANYANTMKAMANRARKEMMSTGDIKYNAAAKTTYASEVSSLMAKLNLALRNAPRERQAQVLAKAELNAKVQANPDMTKPEIKKASQQALARARVTVGAQRHEIEVTDKEWEAIQSGAISPNKLTQIIAHTNIDKLREKATPRATKELSDAKQGKIAAMKASGYTNAQIAEALNISVSTVFKYST